MKTISQLHRQIHIALVRHHHVQIDRVQRHQIQMIQMKLNKMTFNHRMMYARQNLEVVHQHQMTMKLKIFDRRVGHHRAARQQNDEADHVRHAARLVHR